MQYQDSSISVYTDGTIGKITINAASGTRQLRFGNLTPNASYTIQRDGVSFLTATSDANGTILFTTSGTGSHEYKLNY